jgi:hypothetical protein
MFLIYDTIISAHPQLTRAKTKILPGKCKNRGTPHRGFCNKKRGEEK